VQIALHRLDPLFCFESADLFQIGKRVFLPPEVDVLPFHIVGLHIQPDEFFQNLMFLG